MRRKGLVPIGECLPDIRGFLMTPRALALNPAIAPAAKVVYGAMLHHSRPRRNPGCISSATRAQVRRLTGLGYSAITHAYKELTTWKWIAATGSPPQHLHYLRTIKHPIPSNPELRTP